MTARGKLVFVGTATVGIFRSLDTGNTWSAADSGLTNKKVYALQFSGTHLFAGTKGGGVYLSNDSGQSWKPFNGGLTDTNIISLGANDNYLFAGTDSSGGRIWRFPLSQVAVQDQPHSLSQQPGLKILSSDRAGASISISFALPSASRAQLAIYNLSGHLISTLADKPFSAGSHNLQWDTRSVAPDCYMLRLQAGGKAETRVVPVFR